MLSGVLSDAVPGVPGRLTIANSETSGRIVLSGASTYSGPTTVDPGATLIVNGSIVSPVTVAGALGGTGIVGPTSITGGTLAPGNSIGTLTVQGNLSFAPGSVFAVEVSPSVADRTNVTGSASLQGTTVANFASGNYSSQGRTLLSAAGGVAGRFDSLATIGLPQGLLTSLTYTPTDVMLNLTAALGRGTVLTGNESAVATAINTSFNSGNSLPSGLATVFSQGGATLASSLKSLSGEAQAGVQFAAFGFGNLFLKTVMSGGPGTGSQQGVQYASMTAAEAGPEARRLRAWMAGFGGYGWLQGADSTGSSPVQSTAQGLAAGADWTFDHGMVGAVLASGTSNWFLDDAPGSGRANVFQAGVYGRADLGPVYLSAAGAWGTYGVNAQRSVPFLSDSLAASYSATTWSARAEMGYRFTLGEFGVTPFVAGQSQILDTPGFCETSRANSGAALCFNATSTSSLRSELGIEATADLGSILGSKANVVARLAWAHEYETTGFSSAWFQALPGSAFSVWAASLPSDMGIARLMSDHALDDRWSLRLQVDAELAQGYGSLAGTARLAARF